MGTLLLFPGVVTAQAAVGPFDGNSALLAAVVAFLLPPILAVPMQAGWSSQAKAVVAFVVCLGVAAVIVYVNGMLDAADYVRTARSKGLPEALVLRRHALRNSLIPIVTIGGILAVIWMVAG